MISKLTRVNPKNVIILGSARNGTSMVAGTLFGKGYYMGSDLYAGTISNPKGFFESWDIQGLSEHLLAQVVPTRSSSIPWRWIFRKRPLFGQIGLSARVPVVKCDSRFGPVGLITVRTQTSR